MSTITKQTKSVGKTIQSLIDMFTNIDGDRREDFLAALSTVGCKSGPSLLASFAFFSGENLLFKLTSCAQLVQVNIRDNLWGIAGASMVDCLKQFGSNWQGRLSQTEMENWFGMCGIPIHNHNRQKMEDLFSDSVASDRDERERQYSIAQVLRTIFGPDKAWEGIDVQAIRRAIATEDPKSSGWVKAGALERFAPQPRRLAQRVLGYSYHSTPSPDPEKIMYGPLVACLVDTFDEAMHFFVNQITQSQLIYLLSAFCGGIKGTPDSEDRGWSGPFKESSIFGRDTVLAADIEVLLRSVSGVGLPEASIRLVSAFFDKHQRGAVNCKEFLTHVWEARVHSLDRVLASIAKQESPSRIAGCLSDLDNGTGEISELQFVLQMWINFPFLRYVPWPQIAREFRNKTQSSSNDTTGIAGIEPTATATTLKATGSQEAPDSGPGGIPKYPKRDEDAPSALLRFPLSNADGQVMLSGLKNDVKVEWRVFITELENVAYSLRSTGDMTSLSIPGNHSRMNNSSSVKDLSSMSHVEMNGEVRKVPGREVFLCVHGIRDQLKKMCIAADTNCFGTVKRVEMMDLLHKAGARLHEGEMQALVDFADMRGDGNIPYRSFLRRVEVMLGARNSGSSFMKGLPTMHTVHDFWVNLWRAIQDRAPDMNLREVFGGAAAPGEHITRPVFFHTLHRLGVLVESRDAMQGSPSAAAIGAVGEAPRPPTDFALRAVQELAAEAYNQLDPHHVGKVLIDDIERCLDRVSHRAPPLTHSYIPSNLDIADDSLKETIAMVASDFLSEDLSSFEAFAYLDSSRTGVVSEADFCANMASAVPILSMSKARLLFRFIQGIRIGGSAAGGITLGQFSHVFPLTSHAPLVARKVWQESIVNRIVRTFHTRGWTLEQAFNKMQNHAGQCTMQSLQDAANRLSCGVSPQEITMLFSSLQDSSASTGEGRVSYRTFVRVLQPGYNSLDTKYENEQIRGHQASEKNVKHMVSTRCYQVRSPLAVFRKFASGVRLARGELRSLLAYLGVAFNAAQLTAFWKLVDPMNTGVVTEKGWCKVLNHQQNSVDNHWGSVFSRLEIACTAKGLSFKSMLEDLDMDEDGFLSVPEASRIFTKLGVAVSRRDVDDWAKAVASENDPTKIEVARATAITLNKAYKGPSFAALRLHSSLYQANITGRHALDVILAGRGISFGSHHNLRGIVLSRGDIVSALNSLNLEFSSGDISTLLEFLDPTHRDEIAASRFLRVAEPDPAAERNRLKQMGIELPEGPIPGEVLHKLLADLPIDEAGVASLALTDLAHLGQQVWVSEPSDQSLQHSSLDISGVSGSKRDSRRPRGSLRSVGRENRPQTRIALEKLANMGISQGRQKIIKEKAQAQAQAAADKADAVLLRLLETVNFDATLVSVILPAAPPHLPIRDINLALAPIGFKLSMREAEILREKYPEIISKDHHFNISRFIQAVRDTLARHQQTKDTSHRFSQDQDERLVRKFRARLWGTGLDLPRSVLLGRKVRYARGIMRDFVDLAGSYAQAYVVPFTELESVLTSLPLSMSPKEAHELVHTVGAHCFAAADKIDVIEFEKIFINSGEFISDQAIDPVWVGHIHHRLQLHFGDCMRAFDYLDRMNEGCVDVNFFVDSVLRVMTNTVPMSSNLTGIQILQSDTGVVQANRATYVPDTFAGVHALDVSEIEDCTITCRKLFNQLASRNGGHGMLLGFSDFERFWRLGLGCLEDLIEEREEVKPLPTTDLVITRQVPDFWSHQVAEAICAFAQADHWEALSPDANRGRQCYLALYRQVLRYLSVVFAPHLITSKKTDRGGSLVAINCAELSGFDLDTPLAGQLDVQAQRLVQRVLGKWTNTNTSESAVLNLKKAANETLASVAGESFSLHPMEATDKVALQLFRSYSAFCYVLHCSHRLKQRIDDVNTKAKSTLEKYAGTTVWTRMVESLDAIRACVRDMKGVVAHEALHQVHLFQQTVLGLHPAPKRKVNKAEITQFVKHLNDSVRSKTVPDLKVNFQKCRYFDGDRKAYDADHPSGFPCIAEVVGKNNISESHFFEAALWNTIGGLNAEEMSFHLRPDQRQGEWALANAKFVQFHGYRVLSDFFLVKEYMQDGEWGPLSQVVRFSGGLASHWLTGGQVLFKLLCRQILGLLMMLHKKNIVARCLRLEDIYISSDGKHMAIHSLRYASVTPHQSTTRLPDMHGAWEHPMPPEFYQSDQTLTCDTAVDVWNFGVLAYEMLFGCSPTTFTECISDRARRTKMDATQLKGKFPNYIPNNFVYSPFRNIPDDFKQLMFTAQGHFSNMSPPPRGKMSTPEAIITALFSFSAALPRPPAKFLKDSNAHNLRNPIRNEHTKTDYIPDGMVLEDSDDEDDFKNKDHRAVSATMIKEGRVADVIALCLHVNPSNRPGLLNLLQCTVFDHDQHDSVDDATQWLSSTMEKAVHSPRPEMGSKRKSVTMQDEVDELAKTKDIKDAAAKKEEPPVAPVEIPPKQEPAPETRAAPPSQRDWNSNAMHQGVANLSQSWASQAVGSKVVQLEKHLRVMCGYVFHHENGFTPNQATQFHSIMKEVSDLLVNHASPQAFEAVARCSVLHYLAFCALRTREKSPECLDAFWGLMQAVVSILQMPEQFGRGREYIVDLLANLTCGREIPVDIPLELQTRFFMRSAAWYGASGSTPDVFDEVWRHDSQPENHFGGATFPLFQPLLKLCLNEQWEVLKRPSRGKRYLEALVNASSSLFKFYQGNSVAGQRAAVAHATSAVVTNSQEVLLAIADLEFPQYTVASLGSHDEPLAAAAVKFFEQVEMSLNIQGEPKINFAKQIDSVILAKFCSHHSARGIMLLSRVLKNPDFNNETRYAAARLLLHIASAEGKVSRAAMRCLYEFVGPNATNVDQSRSTLQPMVRRLVADSLMSPTPTLVHAAYSLPNIFRLLDLSSDMPAQPHDLDDVYTQAQTWLQKTRQLPRGTNPNWFSIIPLCAWVRHLARINRTRSLFNCVSALFSVYQDAFLHADMPSNIGASRQGGLLSMARVHPGAAQNDGRFGPTRFMYEFVALLEYVFKQFGPASLVEPAETLAHELTQHALLDTPWHMTVLNVFSVITDRTVLSVKDYQGYKNADVNDLHPSRWSTQRWFDELAKMKLGTQLTNSIMLFLDINRNARRRPQLSDVALPMFRSIWKNILKQDSGSSLLLIRQIVPPICFFKTIHLRI